MELMVFECCHDLLVDSMFLELTSDAMVIQSPQIGQNLQASSIGADCRANTKLMWLSNSK